MFIINKDLRHRCTAIGTAIHGLPQRVASRHINLFKADVFGSQQPNSTAAIGTHYRCVNFNCCQNITHLIWARLILVAAIILQPTQQATTTKLYGHIQSFKKYIWSFIKHGPTQANESRCFQRPEDEWLPRSIWPRLSSHHRSTSLACQAGLPGFRVPTPSKLFWRCKQLGKD